MKYSLQNLVEEYTQASHYKPSKLPPTNYTSTSYTPSRYTSSSYTPSYHTTTQYTPTYTSTLHTPSKSLTNYTPASIYTPALRASASNTSKGRAAAYAKLSKSARSVHFPNDILFQDYIRRGDMEHVQRFLRTRKVRVNSPFPTGLTALHEAVLTGNVELVKLLVTYGADVQERDGDGWTALHMACSDGYPEIARYLLSLGASKVARTESGEMPADLIDPECKELVELFDLGCV